MLLAGDIGGTKTNLALFATKEDLHSPLHEAKFSSANYATLAALVQDFLLQHDLINIPIRRAVFGVAGPVVEGKAKATNLPWHIEESQLQQALKIPEVTLLNDLAAMGTAIPLLTDSDIFTLNEGKPVPHGTLVIVAPGTGLGEAILTWDGGGHYLVHPSEGGHTDFAPTNAFEIGLLVHMLERWSHVSYEQVCSGLGLPNIYAYLKEAVLYSEPSWLGEMLAKAKDLTPVIVNAAKGELEGQPGTESVDICVGTVKTFVAILGAEAGNMALKALATGGVYLSGGVPPRILTFLQEGEFMRSFKNKGRFADMLADIPVHVILNPNIGLIGAAAHGFGL
jgi:glucokinase